MAASNGLFAGVKSTTVEVLALGGSCWMKSDAKGERTIPVVQVVVIEQRGSTDRQFGHGTTVMECPGLMPDDLTAIPAEVWPITIEGELTFKKFRRSRENGGGEELQPVLLNPKIVGTMKGRLPKAGGS